MVDGGKKPRHGGSGGGGEGVGIGSEGGGAGGSNGVMRLLGWLHSMLDVRLAGWILIYLFMAPYTKVEESFGMEATHDLLAWGIPWGSSANATRAEQLRANYDHFAFPGPVQRSFVGSILLAAAVQPVVVLLRLAGVDGLDGGGEGFGGLPLQVAVRAALGVWNAVCLTAYGRGIGRALGAPAAEALAALQASQFHLLFYASRTLPNFVALGPVLLALRDLLPMPLDDAALASSSSSSSSSLSSSSSKSKRNEAAKEKERQKTAEAAATAVVRRLQRGLVLLTVAGIVLRSEVAVLLATHTAGLLLRRRLTLAQTIAAGAVGVTLGLGLTVPIDSFFYQLSRPSWPELDAFVFNVVESRASDWGTSPWHFYFANSLPRILFNPLVLLALPLGLVGDVSGRTRAIALPCLAFVAILSAQAHKEWRFIVYVQPPLTAVAAVGVQRLLLQSKQRKVRFLAKGAFLLSTLACAAASFAFALVSSLNYPGAAALNRFHLVSQATDAPGPIAVHLDTLTCLSGVTRFLQIPTPPATANTSSSSSSPSSPSDDIKTAPPRIQWSYDKSEDERLLDPKFWDGFHYVITETPERAIGAWEIVQGLGTVTGYSGFVLTKSTPELERQYANADLAGDPQLDFADLGRKGLMWWNWLGLRLSRFTGERWPTLRMEPMLYILRATRGAL